MHVSLTPKLEELVRDKIQSGLYNNASEVIREAPRLMSDHDDARRLKLRLLRAELKKGEADLAQGRSTTIKNDRELRKFFADP